MYQVCTICEKIIYENEESLIKDGELVHFACSTAINHAVQIELDKLNKRIGELEDELQYHKDFGCDGLGHI